MKNENNLLLLLFSFLFATDLSDHNNEIVDVQSAEKVFHFLIK